MNHFANGAFHSKTFRHGFCQESSFASRDQNLSGCLIDSRYIRRYCARFLIFAFCANAFGGLKTRLSFKCDSMFRLSIFMCGEETLTSADKLLNPNFRAFLFVLLRQQSKSEAMSDHIYKKIELVGSSPNGIEDAVKNALNRAKKTVRNMRWFEIAETRGYLEEGNIAHWQVTLKVGFTLEG
jgi:flavin-binding protein dodecin